jgi:hypothetical protein
LGDRSNARSPDAKHAKHADHAALGQLAIQPRQKLPLHRTLVPKVERHGSLMLGRFEEIPQV